MVQQALEQMTQEIALVLSPEDKNAIVQEVAKESAERINDAILERYREGFFATILPQEPEERFRVFLLVTNTWEFEYIRVMGADWVKAVAQGRVPPPVSLYWQALLQVPVIAQEEAKLLKDLYKRYIEPKDTKKPKRETREVEYAA